ncbi:SRPBCC family protein [Thermoactinospora rubra]|uniref:SRPBCC family protein n=1 Tax=Thermoactinospora rubra TaxID=1088767 RepID=UPI000A0FCD95|nr:carbon monoxide dehydrogenase subunit G [Thermoactinospora rubra]
MKVTGSAVIGADRERVWAALRDPAVLVRTIPGCRRLEETGPDSYRMTVSAGVASIKGVYQGEVSLSEPLEPERFVLKARGQGAPGTVEATVEVRLSEADGGTRVDYDADAVVGGMIGGVGQRMLGAAARRTAGEFFAAVDQALSGAPAVRPATEERAIEERAPQPQAARTAGAAVWERPAAPTPETRPVLTLAAFGLGAAVALAGVAVGWALARRTRRG